MNSYCTLFDSNYLIRGLTMYKSLVNTGEKFTLYIVCFDTLTFELLAELKLRHIILIALDDFETDVLKAVKKERTPVEYFWTSTSHIIRYVLDTYQLKEVTYLDADLFFFSKPSILLDEFHNSGCSVMITKHRYSPLYDQSATAGIYCVQFLTIKADENGLRVLTWWQERCLEWCFARFEKGKFGDQKYLDHWPYIFEGVHVLTHLGGGVAPWNVQQYTIGPGPTVNGVPVVFYHFHNLKFKDDGWYIENYSVPKEAKEHLYIPYLADLYKLLIIIEAIDGRVELN